METSRRDLADADLVSAARTGDRGAYARLVERHWPLLLALCRRTLRDRWLAEDAAQEAVLQAMLSLDSLRRPDAFGAWLAGIGLNVCRRALRASRSSALISPEAQFGGVDLPSREIVDPGPSPAEIAESSELGERVLAAVDLLPRGQRTAVLLFYLEGLTHREVAEALGLEVGAVKARLHKARRSLRQHLSPLWSETGGALGEHGDVGEDKTMKTEQPGPVRVQVLDVRRVPGEGDVPTMHVVVLEEVGGERRLQIWIGEWEGVALAMQLTSQPPPRPMTYALVAALLGEVGATVRQVAITRLTNNVFYASVEVVGPEGHLGMVDARPSDALNVALATSATIVVEESVFESAAHPATPPPYPNRDAFGPSTAGARELLAAAVAEWPKLPTQQPPP